MALKIQTRLKFVDNLPESDVLGGLISAWDGWMDLGHRDLEIEALCSTYLEVDVECGLHIVDVEVGQRDEEIEDLFSAQGCIPHTLMKT